jgi:limonene-1,2-epoxide hydrolase
MATNAQESAELALVRRFFEDINEDHFDAAIDLLAEDVLYHNIPMPEMRGRENVRQFHKAFGVGTRVRVDWRLLRIARDGDTVLTERSPSGATTSTSPASSVRRRRCRNDILLDHRRLELSEVSD